MDDFKKLLLEGAFVPKVNEALHKETINDLARLRNIISPIIQQHPDVEKFYTLYLDAKNGLLLLEPSFTGSLTGCSVYPREIIKKALEVGAAALIVSHNHPSGDLTPSTSDKLITKSLFIAAALHGITLHDHVVCSPTSYFSFNEEGLISEIRNEWEGFSKTFSWGTIN
jgi:DNA repair protein RadC